MIRFKIFFGTAGCASCVSADVKVNEWLEQNPDIEILEIKYQQSRFGDHSICIMYEEY